MPSKDPEHLHIRQVAIFIALLIITFIGVAYYLNFTDFIYYNAFILVIVGLFYKYHRTLHVNYHIFLLGTVFAFIHVAGGTMGLYQLSFHGIGYDNIVHFYGSMMMALIAYNFMRAHMHRTRWEHLGASSFILILVLLVLGAGTVVEIMEFGGVVFFGAQQVGSYFNNAIDLVVDGLGGLVVAIYLLKTHHQEIVKL